MTGEYVVYLGSQIESVMILHDRIVIREKPKKRGEKGKRRLFRIGLNEELPNPNGWKKDWGKIGK